ncbi:MAG: Glutamate synthase [NADPH] small chain, partial [uncultured Solirubrobacteraceae bacterium]
GRAGCLPEDRAAELRVPRPGRPGQGLQGVPRPEARSRAARPGRAVHGVRHPVLPQRLPAGEPHPRLERPRLPRPLVRRDQAAARDEQLPRVHGAAVPGAVRGRVRARDPRGRRGDDQADRELDHRPGVGRGLGQAVAAVVGDGLRGRRRGCGPGGHGRGPAAAPRGPARGPVRARL